MDRVLDTSQYHLRLSVSILKVKVIQCHEVRERSNSCCLGGVVNVFGQFFFLSRTQKGP